MSLSSKIEAILFFKAEPISLKRLSQILEESETSIKEALNDLKNSLEGRGLSLLERDSEYILGTNPEFSSIIEKLQKEELSKDLSKASLETLSIILYKGPISRSEIDFIRGVNSTFILRNLMIRGLVEKILNPKDSRSYLYKPSFETLSYLGISSVENLPDREKVLKEIESFKESTEIDSNGEKENANLVSENDG